MFFRLVTLFLLLSSVAACSSIPLTSVPKLAALNPRTMEFGTLEVAARVNENFRVKEDGARFTLRLENTATTEVWEEELVLRENDDPATPFLRKQQKRGTQIVRYQIRDEDLSRVAAFREQFLELERDRTTEGQKRFSLGASMNGCAEPGSNPFRSFKLKIYMRTSPNEEFYTLVKEQSIAFAPTTEPGEEPKGISYCQQDE